MNKIETVLEKIAAEEKDKRTFPISRALETSSNIGSYGLSGFVRNRALQGRVNKGEKNFATGTEEAVASKLKKEDNGKTYPISRYLTSIPGQAGTSAGISTLGGLAMMSRTNRHPVSIAAGAALAGAAGGASAYLARGIHARALKGRAEKGREGWGARERNILKDLKKEAAVENDHKRYPISRAASTYSNIGTYGLQGFIDNRARQGRVNAGSVGLIGKSDKAVASTLTKEEGGKKYRISRAFTNPYVSAGVGTLSGAVAGHEIAGTKGAIIGGVAGTALGAGEEIARRAIGARALLGREEVGRTGWGAREKGVLQKIKEQKAGK